MYDKPKTTLTWRPLAVGCVGSLITLALFVAAATVAVWAIRWLA